MIKLHNLILFVSICLERRFPIYRWPQAWRGVQAAHLAWVRKEIWEAKKKGLIREDEEGKLWAK